MDKAEFSQRAQDATQKLYRVACAYLSQPCDREDALQEALLRAWQKRHSLRESAYFETWLTRILVRVCIDMGKSRKRMIPTDTFPDQAAPQPQNTGLREAIDHLEPALRIVVVLYYVEGYDTKTVAQIMKLPQGTVKSRLARARKLLQSELKEGIPV